MPGLFSKPKVETQQQAFDQAPELDKEQQRLEAEKMREQAKNARRVSTILAGPRGVEEEVDKTLNGQAILLGTGKPLKRAK